MNKAKKMTMWIMSPIMLGCLSLGFVFNAPSAMADEVQTFTVDTCEVRLNDPTGLRFTASMSDSYYQNAIKSEEGKTVSFGMLVIPAAWAETLEENNYISSLSAKLEGTDLTVADLTTNSLAFQNTDAQGNLVNANDTKWYIQGSLASVLYQNYNYDYTAIGFVKTTINGTTTYAYADFDENDYHNLTEVASKSLNIVGYENNTTIQNFVKRGLCQANGYSALDADGMDYETLVENLGLSVNVNKDHVQVNDTINYSVSADGEFDSFDNLALTAVSNNENVVKVEDGKLKAVGNGVATISLKNGQTYAESKTIYVGSEALALYDTYKYSGARHGKYMGNITATGSATIVKGVNTYANTPSLVDAPVEIATAYQTTFGEALSNQAYYMSLTQAKLDNNDNDVAYDSTVTTRLSEVKIALPDADYVLENYKYIKARVYVDATNATTEDFWMGTYILDKNVNVISDMASNCVAKNDFGGWMEVYFPMPTLLDGAMSDVYYLTLGMDLQRTWGTTEIYVGNVEFCNEADLLSLFRRNLTAKSNYNLSYCSGHGNWGRTNIATSGKFNNLPETLANAYATQYNENASQVLAMTPNMSEFKLLSSVSSYACMQTNKIEYSQADGTKSGTKAGTALVGALGKATKVVMRVYVATNATGVSNISAMLATSGNKVELAGAGYVAGTESTTKERPALKDVALNQWVDVELTIPAYYKDNKYFELNFNLYNFKNLLVDGVMPSDVNVTIYVAGLWFM